MKKITLTISLLFVFLNVFSQENKQISHSEIKVNAAYLIAGKPEIGYEYILNEESSVGVDLLFAIDDNPDFKFALTPYYRLYFGKKRAAGFFVEGFGMLNIIEDDYIIYYDYDASIYGTSSGDTHENYTNFALGIAVGGKFLTKSEFLFEIYGGIGRNLFNNDNNYNNYEFVPRIGVTIGKRF